MSAITIVKCAAVVAGLAFMAATAHAQLLPAPHQIFYAVSHY